MGSNDLDSLHRGSVSSTARRDPFDAVLDARSEARYTDDPSAEPDTREVSERAMMPTQGAVSPAERLYGHG